MTTPSRRAGLLLSLFLATTWVTPTRAADDPAGPRFSLDLKEGEWLDILHQGRPIARYMFAYDDSTPARRHDTYKPYLHVFDPSGQRTITKGPGGEFTHHRGIFIGWNKIHQGERSFDLWHMPGKCHQLHREFLQREVQGATVLVRAKIDWLNDADEVLLTEERRFTLRAPEKDFYLSVECESQLTAPANITLDGDPEHAGQHFRPANDIEKQNTRYVYPREQPKPHEDVDYPWVGEMYTLEGKPYCVALLNHPDNPQGTRFSAYRDYGRFGAFPKAALTAGQPLTLKYAFLIGEGKLPVAAVEARVNEYSGGKAVSGQVTELPAEGSRPSK